ANAHQLARHEERADLGILHATVAQPHRPVAHERARGEEVGGAVAGEPDGGQPARHHLSVDDGGIYAANSRRISAECCPTVGTSPSRSRSPGYDAASAGIDTSPFAVPKATRLSCGWTDRSVTALTRAQAICAASRRAASPSKLCDPKLFCTMALVSSRRALRAWLVA